MADLSKRQYAQLTYSSFDNGSGRGGWQVKQVVGELSAIDQETLTNRIWTSFDLEPRLPDFPTEEQVLSRPARLCHGVLPDGSSVLWHTVDAGRDGSGRPGNVFAHVVVDRDPGAVDGPLPISRWRSEGWLRPYGAPAVAAAQLVDARPPAPNPVIGPPSAIAFVSASMQRQQLLRALIDAVVARMQGGPTIVLQTANHEESVAWISSITHLLPPSAGKALSWSTHDRPENASAQIAAGTDLICVPAADDVEVPGALVIAAAELPDLALPGGSHRFASGRTVAATDLSELAEAVLADPDIAAQILQRQAQIETEFAGDTVAPVWTTAVAVLDQPDLIEFHAVARRAVAKHYPAAVGRVGWAAEMVERAQLEHPPSPAELLRRVQGPNPSSVLTTTYCEAVLADGSWRNVPITQIPVAPVADLGAIPDAVNSALREVHAIAANDPVGGLPPVLHLAEFLRRLGAPSQAKDEANGHLRQITRLTRLRPDATVRTDSWPAVAPFSEIDWTLLGSLWRMTLHRGDPQFLGSLSAAAWLKVFLTTRQNAGDGFLPANPSPEDLAVYPYAALALLRDQKDSTPLTPQQRTDLAIEGIESCLAAELVSDADSRTLTGELLRQAPAATVHLGGWLAKHPGRIAGAGMRETVVSAAPNSDLLQIAATAGPDSDQPEGLADVARLRLWILDPSGIDSRQRYVATVERALSLPDLLRSGPASDLLTALDAGVLLARVDNAGWLAAKAAVLDDLHRGVTGREADTVAWLQRLIDYRVIDDSWVLGLSFLGYTESARERRPADRATGIADALLDPAAVATTTAGALRDAAWPLIRQRSAGEAEDFFNDYPKSANGWLRDHHPTGSIRSRLGYS